MIIKYHNLGLKGLVDTGSEFSCVNEDIYKKLKILREDHIKEVKISPMFILMANKKKM